MTLDAYPEVLRCGETARVRTSKGGEYEEMRDYHESHCIIVILAILCNHMLSKSPIAHEYQSLAHEREMFCNDAMMLAEECMAERPLSAHFVAHATFAAWLVTRDSIKKEKLKKLLGDYRGTFSMGHLLQGVAKWPEAPPGLADKLPWFPAPKTTSARHSAVHEACCIL